MNHKWLSKASLFAMSAMLVAMPAFATDEARYQVAVSISADGAFANEFRSCINREIRKLGDVVIVESDARFTLEVVAMPTNVGGKVAGYTASAVVLDHTDANTLSANVWRDSISQGAKAVAGQVRSGVMLPFEIKSLGRIPWHVVYTRVELQSLCIAITADFDVDVIEVARRETAETHTLP